MARRGRWRRPDQKLEKARGEIEQTNQVVKHHDIKQRIQSMDSRLSGGAHHSSQNPRNHLAPPNLRAADECEMKTKEKKQ
jgi:hypothetical protein